MAEIKIKDIQKKETRSEIISIRTYKRYCKFMKAEKISPSKLFNVALKEIIDKKSK